MWLGGQMIVNFLISWFLDDGNYTARMTHDYKSEILQWVFDFIH